MHRVIFLTNGCLICTRNKHLETYRAIGNNFSTRFLNELESRILNARTITQLKFCSLEHKDIARAMRTEHNIKYRRSLREQIKNLKIAYANVRLAEIAWRQTGGRDAKLKIQFDHVKRVAAQRERRIREEYSQPVDPKVFMSPLERMIEQARAEIEKTFERNNLTT